MTAGQRSSRAVLSAPVVKATLAYLRYLVSLAHLQNEHLLWRPFLRDPDDDMLLECAVASSSPFIVTHNVKDFQRAVSLNVRAIKPADFPIRLRSPT